jgi:hypothetical protein
MGLTIHYSLQSHARSAEDAGELVRQLRQRATALPFDHVSDVVDLVGSACDFQQTARDDPNRWLLVQAGRHVEVEADGNTYLLAPRRLIAFTTTPGEGCEPANFGLCRYRARSQRATTGTCPREFRLAGRGSRSARLSTPAIPTSAALIASSSATCRSCGCWMRPGSWG